MDGSQGSTTMSGLNDLMLGAAAVIAITAHDEHHAGCTSAMHKLQVGLTLKANT